MISSGDGVYLKSITLKGFKSFPERTRLEFGPGVSVIVGPNGSGKSNVTDAVLWALGEQSPVAVRGQSMQDVIFGGAPGRQAGKSAEVELVLDDSEGSLALGAPEVSIIRRLDRAGEGEYRLAGARCRLVDVIEVLSDTGLGKEMHSVISQGRVEAIVTSKPRDRRLLIEEAAGLGKHRKRRRRAQLKLERTQDNLDRALDVEREARSRLRPLKRQAEAAELHARIERQSLEARWELARDQTRGQLEALRGAEREASQARSRLEQVEHELKSVAARREAAEEALAQRSARREELSRRCYVAQSAGDRVAYRAEAARSGASAIEARLLRARDLLSSLERDRAGDVADPDAAARIVALEEALATLDRDREAELATELGELERQLSDLRSQVSERGATLDERQHERERCDQELEAASLAVRDAERAVEAARAESAHAQSELAAAHEFLRNQGPSRAGASTMADELEVDGGYELAVAAALDGRLHAAVVPDLPTATTVLDGAGSDGARALVAPKPGAADPDRASGGPHPDAERLLDHVRGGGHALALARELLRDAWVVDTFESVSEAFTGVAVTRGGRVWSAASRELRQAAAVGEERVLAERNRREQLVRASEQAAGAEREARSGLERARERLAQLDRRAERAILDHRAAVRARDEAAEEERRLGALMDRRRAIPEDGPDAGRRAQLTAELAAERSMLERAQRERAEREEWTRRLRAAIERDAALGPAAAAAIEALEAVAGAIAAKRGVFEQALTADREAGEHVAAELRACAQKEATMHTQLHGKNEELTTLEVHAQRMRDQAAEAEHELAELAQRLQLEATPAESEMSIAERDALDAQVQRLARRREQLGPVNPLAQDEYGEALEHVEELERQRADL
jgi:chromosome segregation protein